MQDDQLLVLANKFVDIKVPFADAEYKKQLAVEVKNKIEETINLELMSSMSPEQAENFNDLLENNGDDEQAILDYIAKCDINIDNLTAVALTKFRAAYLGE